jgi:HEAT repeat protein
MMVFVEGAGRQAQSGREQTSLRQPRDLAGLLATLGDEAADARRWAALDLAGEQAAVTALADRLGREPSRPVRDAIVTALAQTGGALVAAELAKHLRSDDAAVRTTAVRGLGLVEATAALVPALLADFDSDVRVLCVMVLAA